MKRIAWSLLALVLAAAAPARADIWPAKPIHIVVTFAPGGAAKPLTPDELAAFMAAETARWTPIAQAATKKQ